MTDSASDDDGIPDWIQPEADERVSLRETPSRKLLLGAFGLAFVVLVVLSVLVAIVSDIGTGRRLSGVIIVLTVGVILYAFYIINRLDYVVTDRRAVVGVGLFSKRVDEVALDDVEDVVVERSAWQQWLGTGTVRLDVHSGSPLRYAFVERPHVVSEQILSLLESRSTRGSTVAG